MFNPGIHTIASINSLCIQECTHMQLTEWRACIIIVLYYWFGHLLKRFKVYAIQLHVHTDCLKYAINIYL